MTLAKLSTPRSNSAPIVATDDTMPADLTNEIKREKMAISSAKVSPWKG